MLAAPMATADRPAQVASAPSPEDFGALFSEHGQAIFTFCFRRTGDWALAEDLMSTVFFEAWRRRADVDLVGQPALPWLYGVATNVVRNARRSLRRHRAALARMPRAEAAPDFAEDVAGRIDDERRMRLLLTVMEQLPVQEREVVELCGWAGLSYENAARALDVPVGTVRSRLSRGRARLQALSEEDAR
jgi:RNA polymerase sigma-70 factor (ECF subfamily)